MRGAGAIDDAQRRCDGRLLLETIVFRLALGHCGYVLVWRSDLLLVCYPWRVGVRTDLAEKDEPGYSGTNHPWLYIIPVHDVLSRAGTVREP